MTGDPLRHNANLVESLGSALRSSEHGLGTVPGLLRQILTDESWREFVTQLGDHVTHERFIDFVETPPLKGLGSDIDLIRRVAAGDAELLDLLDQALQNPHGGDRSNVNNVNVGRPEGNRTAAALRRLRKDRPDLHAQVLANELSAHRAMIEAGFRPRTVTVRTDRPDSIARTLRKNLTPEALAELAKLLKDDP